MSIRRFNLKPVVAATVACVFLSLPGQAQEGNLGTLLERLKAADAVDAARIEREIEMRRAQSGSAAMDLLLKRGREAMEADDVPAAIEHYSALVDHAPEFAEGWYRRARALAQSGRIGPAVEDLNRALVLEPRHFDAIFGLGTIFERLEQPEKALAAYRLVLELHPHHEGAQARLSHVDGAAQGTEL